MNITLPESVRNWVEAHAGQARKTPDEFVLALVEEAQKRDHDLDELMRRDIRARTGQDATPELMEEAKRKLEAQLIEGLESGPATPMDWDAIRRRVAARLD